jgi:hypothetical protein
MGPRIYTPREASALVPKLTKAFDDVDAIRARLKTIKGKVDVLEMIWGDEVRAETNPDHREVQRTTWRRSRRPKKDFDAPTAPVRRLRGGRQERRAGPGRLLRRDRQAGWCSSCWQRGEKSIEFLSPPGGRIPRPAAHPGEELAR